MYIFFLNSHVGNFLVLPLDLSNDSPEPVWLNHLLAGMITDRDKFTHFKVFVNMRNLIMSCSLVLRADATLTWTRIA